MKRLVLASTLALATAGSAFAATEAEITRIQQFIPTADVSTWTDAQVAEAMTIITSNESRAEIVGRIQALHNGENYAMAPSNLTEAEMAQLNQYVSGVDYSLIPRPTIDAALNVANSEMSASDREGKIERLLSGDSMDYGSAGSITASEATMLEEYAPGIDVTTLTVNQVDGALAIIYSTESRTDAEQKVQAYLMQ
jgi:hypothetical protein